MSETSCGLVPYLVVISDVRILDRHLQDLGGQEFSEQLVVGVSGGSRIDFELFVELSQPFFLLNQVLDFFRSQHVLLGLRSEGGLLRGLMCS